MQAGFLIRSRPGLAPRNLRGRQPRQDQVRAWLLRGTPQEDEAHLVRGLLAHPYLLRRTMGVKRVLVRVVVERLDLETGTGRDLDRLFQVVELLPVVVPVFNRHE